MLSQSTIDIVKSTAPILAVHGTSITTVFYKNMFEAHPELLHIFNHANQAKGRQQTALANTVYAAAANIDQLETIVPAVIQIAHKHRSLGIKPEHYPIVGEHLLRAIKEVLGDAATDEIINAWAEAYGVIADVFITTEENMYKESEQSDGGWRYFKEFTVSKKVRESENITSFYLKPVDGEVLPSYKAGQYITIRLSIPGEQYLVNRQYSLSRASQADEYRISIKREDEVTPKGKVSVYLHEHLNVGDQIEVSAPAGDFYLDEEAQSPVTFISGGVGITPMMSMLESITKTNTDRPVAFLHCARSKEIHAFDDEVSQLVSSLKEANYYTLYANEPNGFITKDFLAKHVLPQGNVYVCGPIPFMEKVIQDLYEIGFKEEQVHFEFFGPASTLNLAHS